MWQFLRGRSAPALIVAIVAAVLAASGTASGLSGKETIDKNDFKRGSVRSAAIRDSTVSNIDIKDRAITTDKLRDDAVTSGKIVAAGVGTTDLADNAVTTPKIADNAVTSAKIADGTVAATDLANGGAEFALANAVRRVGIANGVGNNAGCAGNTLAVVVRNGRGDPVDHRFTFQIPTPAVTYGQIRGDGSIRQSSANVTAVAHTAGTGVYCISFTAAPTGAQLESAVASPHDSG